MTFLAGKYLHIQQTLPAFVNFIRMRITGSFQILIFSVLLAATFACTSPENQREISGKIEAPEPPADLNTLPAKSFAFEYGIDSFQLEVPLDESLHSALEKGPHTYTYFGEAPPAGWRVDYYTMFLSAPSEDIYIQEILKRLRAIAPQKEGDKFAEFVVAFVQGAITYDWKTFHNIDESQIRYPYETVFLGTGVCADKSILLGRLLRELGYDICFFTYPKANHMALGVRVPEGFGNYGTDYAFVESTNYAPIGRIPDNFIGGIKLESRPETILFPGEGKSFSAIVENRKEEKRLEKLYGEEYFFYDVRQKKLKHKMVAVDGEINKLKKESAGCAGTLPPAKYEKCKKLIDELNEKVDVFNTLVDEFNAIVALKNKQTSA